MKIKFDELNSDAKWFLCVLPSEELDKLNVSKNGLDVQFIINGIEMPFQITVDRLIEEFDRQVQERAKEIATQEMANKLELAGLIKTAIDKLEWIRIDLLGERDEE